MESVMYIVAIGWIYVVLMMAITENSVIAGIMTFVLYGVVPLAIILYLSGTKQRRQNRLSAKKRQADSAMQSGVPAGTRTDSENVGMPQAAEAKAGVAESRKD
jgi:hypothetical protein